MHLFVEKLTNVDFSYLDPERGIVGETWWASAILEGALDAQGMVCDFGIVKKVLRNWLDDEIDHRLLVPVLAENLRIEQKEDNVFIEITTPQGIIRMLSPKQAVTLIDAKEITSVTTSNWCIEQLKSHFTDNIDQLKLTFEPEEITGAYYHYSHGLKKHQGNCQRIAHGHRSRIEVWINNERHTEEEGYWAGVWRDIYLGSQEDISHQDQENIEFKYQAQQGEFELSLPAKQCYLMETDTTVEWIADHLAKQVQLRHPNKAVRVRAFEGVNKGAQAQR